jgi:hypothetical protein
MTKAEALAIIDAGVCLIKKTWRPITCLGIAGSILVNGVVIPLQTHTVPDLVGLAALVTALAPFVISRTMEKLKGVEPGQEG